MVTAESSAADPQPSPWQQNYPSGRPMPTYGPSTEDEFITDALEWAYEMLLRRDEMNAAVHCGQTRLSPVTQKVQTALGIWVTRMAQKEASSDV